MLGEPFLSSGALTLRAMPVAAAVVGNNSVGAGLAARDMAAERYHAAALDSRHHLHLVEADMAGIGAAPRRPTGQAACLGGRLRHARRRLASAPRSVSRSFRGNGIVAVPFGLEAVHVNFSLNLPRMSSSRRRLVWSAAASSPADCSRGARC
jgi:hypothetical protein